MPRRYDVVSGSNLPPKLAAVAPRVEEIYRTGRYENRITPELPLVDSALCEILQRERDVRFTLMDMRAIRHYLRMQHVPIASSSRGQYFALTVEELRSTIEEIGDRITALKNIERSLLEAVLRPAMKNGQLPLAI